MDSLFVQAGIVAILYMVLKFAEMRFVNKEMKPIKELVRDMFIVYISVVLGMYIITEFLPSAINLQKVTTKAFTDAPGF